MIGERVRATVNRIENYGLYLSFEGAEIIVLIVDISRDPIPDLRERYCVGDEVQVLILEFIEDRSLYKGSMVDVA